jgi:3-hydroxyacyl-CoA dehydrogenase/enoyl-CoA hydratase/3-hydroxybutyryl-CoA epimerase
MDRRFQLISAATDFTGFSHADVVIEAATENLELKCKIFQELEKHVRPDAIIATNTSSLTIDSMSPCLKHPERFVGMHFFNPVAKMPLVEVVAGKHTSKETLATTVDFCRKLGKSPIVVGDCHGFLVNRIFMMGANEMMRMCGEGYSPITLENEVLDFGMPMGPFELADEVGIDVIYKVSEIFEKAYGERMEPAPLLKLMAEQGLYGKKSGAGFYLYKDKKRLFNPAAQDILSSLNKETKTPDEAEIKPRFLYTMINEAARCLEEKIITRPDYLDLALIMGIGFPPFQGGLLRYADREGIPHIVETLKRFSQTHGSRFTPCSLLVQMAKENKTFYG